MEINSENNGSGITSKHKNKMLSVGNKGAVNTTPLYPSIFIKDRYIVIQEAIPKNKSITKVANYISIKSVMVNIDTEEVYFKLEYLYMNSYKTMIIPREKCLKKKDILGLQKYGLDVLECNATIIMQHLNNEERKAPALLIHSKIGFGMYNNKLIFKHFKSIGVDSKYNENLEIEPHGKYKLWKQMVKEYVIGNIPLELNLVIGLSSALVGMLSGVSPVDTLIVHKCGNSTTGKTTGSRLAISSWGYPDARKNGLFSTWNSTSNALFSILGGNFGLAVAFDEISMCDKDDFTKLIYRLAGGVDKKRLDVDSSLKEVSYWSTTIESNGEFSIFSKAKKNDGLKMRVIEFKNVKWTKDAESADEIKDICIDNYGYAGPKFAAALLKLGIDEVKKVYMKETKNITKLLINEGIKDNFVSRRSDKLAIISTTAKIAKSVLKLNFDLEGITKILINNEKSSFIDRNIEWTAYDYFIEQYLINRKKFINYQTGVNKSRSVVTQNASNETWGKYVNNKNISKPDEISILVDTFKTIMNNGGYDDEKIILKAWKESGILDCEKDRYTRARKLGGTGCKVNVYVIKVIEKEKIPKSRPV